MPRLVVIGLGPIGVSAARAIQASSDLELVGLVDLDPAKVGRTLADLDGGAASPSIVDSLDRVGPADAAIVSTTSHFDALAPLLRDCIARKLHVSSSCEEMAYPALRHAELAAKLNGEARAAGVALVGTGVNPGFVMDLVALQLSSMLTRVTSVKCLRRVDALTRRLPLQQKVGSTMSVARFNELKAAGRIGHKGLAESIALIAAGLGRTVRFGDVVETLEPLVAEVPIESGLGRIAVGQVRGMHNTGRWQGDGLTIELDLIMACAEPNPRDEVTLEGSTKLTMQIPGSTPGDSATVAALINVARVLPRTTPGLKTMLDLPAAAAR